MRVPLAALGLTMLAWLPNAAARSPRLEPAPRFDDATLAALAAEADAAGALGSAGAVAPGLAVDTSVRSAVVTFFQDAYLPAFVPQIGWTGALTGCQPGTTDPTYADATIALVNYFRAMAGLPAGITRDSNLDADTQSAALMMSAQGDLSHDPPPSWGCYSPLGAAAAARSNLALGAHGPEAVRLYMADDDVGNEYVGHRRWLLQPRQQTMATGSTDAMAIDPISGGIYYGSNALWVLNPFGARPTAPEFVAWPPPGYVPDPVVPNRWSFAPNAEAALVDLTQATVEMSEGAGPALPQTLLPFVPGSGDKTLVWEPPGISRGPAAPDARYTVTVRQAKISGALQTFRYAVTLFDPAAVSDTDQDGVIDVSDDCPYAANLDQLDRGGIGTGSAADGRGDACQCGDVSGDGLVTLSDSVLIARSQLQPPTATLASPALCDVSGDGQCTLVDAVVIRRALLAPPSASLVQGCDPAKP